MPIDIFNPVADGMAQGVAIGNLLRNSALQQKQLELQQQSEERVRQHQEATQKRETAELEEHFATNPALRRPTLNERAAATTGFDFQPTGFGVIPVPSDARDRIVKTPGGREYIAKSQEEQLAERIQQAQALQESQISAMQHIRELRGVPLNPEVATELGLPPGFKILPEEAQHFASTIGTLQGRKTAAQQHAEEQKQQLNFRERQFGETVRHNRVEEALKAREADPLGMLGSGGARGNAMPGGADLHGDEFLKTIPAQIGRQVKALAEGRQQFPASFALKSRYWQQMIGLVSQYDPSFDAVNYNARSKTRNAFTAGAESKQVNALNTVIGHLQEMSSAVDKLDNTRWKPVNTLKNFISEQTGDPNITNFKAIRNSVVDELVRVWRQSGGSEQDIQARLKDLDTASSPKQLHGVISKLVDLLQSKLEAFDTQYQTGMGTTAQGFSTLTPKNRRIVEKLKIKAGERVEGQEALPTTSPKVVRWTRDAQGNPVPEN